MTRQYLPRIRPNHAQDAIPHLFACRQGQFHDQNRNALACDGQPVRRHSPDAAVHYEVREAVDHDALQAIGIENSRCHSHSPLCPPPDTTCANFEHLRNGRLTQQFGELGTTSVPFGNFSLAHFWQAALAGCCLFWMYVAHLAGVWG